MKKIIPLQIFISFVFLFAITANLKAFPQAAPTPESDVFARGVQAYSKGNYAQAEKLLSAYLKDNPHSTMRDIGLLWYGRSLMALHRLPDAQDVVATMDKEFPNSPLTQKLREEVQKAASRNEKAPAAAKAAAPTPPPRPVIRKTEVKKEAAAVKKPIVSAKKKSEESPSAANKKQQVAPAKQPAAVAQTSKSVQKEKQLAPPVKRQVLEKAATTKAPTAKAEVSSRKAEAVKPTLGRKSSEPAKSVQTAKAIAPTPTPKPEHPVVMTAQKPAAKPQKFPTARPVTVPKVSAAVPQKETQPKPVPSAQLQKLQGAAKARPLTAPHPVSTRERVKKMGAGVERAGTQKPKKLTTVQTLKTKTKAEGSLASGKRPAVQKKSGTLVSAPSSGVIQGRRDPFRPLVVRAGDEEPLNLPPGKRGLLVDRLTLKGIIKTSEGYLAMVQSSPASGTILLRENDSLYDGVVEKIYDDHVVFRHTAMDKLGKTFQEEVTKRLSGGDSFF